jgi:succinyl-CoA synthetase alpha subunit
MSILVDKKTRVVVQGITGKEGQFHAEQCMGYGTHVVAGVTPGKGGQQALGVPVFDTVAEAVNKAQANCSLIFVPARFAADAIAESAAAGCKVIVCISEGIPARDMIPVYHYVKREGIHLIGPNCPGVISPGKAKVGIMPAAIHKQGKIGVVSRSGTLTYEVVSQLSAQGLGQSTCVGIGGDPVVGMSFIDVLELFNKDKQTEGVVMVGEIGGSAEEEAAEYIKAQFKKPVAAFIAGATAPPGRRMGHAGAIIMGGKGTARDKTAALTAANVNVAKSPALIGEAMKEMMG